MAAIGRHSCGNQLLVRELSATDAGVVRANGQRKAFAPESLQRVLRVFCRFRNSWVSKPDYFAVRSWAQFQTDASVTESPCQLRMVANREAMADTVCVEVIRRLPDGVCPFSFPGVDGDPWLQIIPCRHGHIYPYGGDRLVASTAKRGSVARKLSELDCTELWRDGDDGVGVLFHVCDGPGSCSPQ